MCVYGCVCVCVCEECICKRQREFYKDVIMEKITERSICI